MAGALKRIAATWLVGVLLFAFAFGALHLSSHHWELEPRGSEYCEKIHADSPVRTRSNSWSNIWYAAVGMVAVSTGVEDYRCMQCVSQIVRKELVTLRCCLQG
jgi:hypothetical protein